MPPSLEFNKRNVRFLWQARTFHTLTSYVYYNISKPSSLAVTDGVHINSSARGLIKVHSCVHVQYGMCVRPANHHSNTGLSQRITVRRLISHKPDRHTNTHFRHTHAHTHTRLPPHISCTARAVTEDGAVRGASWERRDQRSPGMGINKENGKSGGGGREVTREEKDRN